MPKAGAELPEPKPGDSRLGVSLVLVLLAPASLFTDALPDTGVMLGMAAMLAVWGGIARIRHFARHG